MIANKNKGFTLIELLIVVGIIAILVAVLAIAILPWLNKAKPRATTTFLKNIGDAVAGEKVIPTEVSFKKDAGPLFSTASSDPVKRSSQILVFYICPSKEVWDKAPNYKGKPYAPKQDPNQFQDSLRMEGQLPMFTDAWERPIWYKIDTTGRFYIMSSGEDGQFSTEDDLIFDSSNSSVKEYKELKGGK